MKTLKIFSLGLLLSAIISTASMAQAYVTINAGMGVPYGYYPPAGYVQVYGGPVYGYPYGRGCNRVYANPYPGYYRQQPYGGGYYNGGYRGGYGYGGHGHHRRCY